MKLSIRKSVKIYFRKCFRGNSSSANSLTSKTILSATNASAIAGVANSNVSTPSTRSMPEKRPYNSASSLRTLSNAMHAFSSLIDNRNEMPEFEANVLMAARSDTNVITNLGSASSSSSPSYQDLNMNYFFYYAF